jgi:TonB-linked SusC/RagA family outer membrane protein
MEKKCFKGFLAFLLLAVVMSFSNVLYAQQKSIEGKITDAGNNPLPGVSIVVKGATIGTVTDVDGMYYLTVPDNAVTLLYSYIGMKTQEIAIGTQTTINVVLEEDLVGLDEVVVIGYGTRVKEEITGSVSTVSADQLQSSNAVSLMNRVQGQVSGVTVTNANQPGGESTIRIRGVGTINDANPLYVIDGVPVGPGNNINPEDVESITILKDASSSAIYGTRGANGVVLITTKRGKINQQPSVNFSAKYGVNQATNKYDMLNTNEYADAVWLSYKNRNVAPNHAQYGTGSSPRIPDYILPAGTMEGAASVNPELYKYPDYQIYKANKQGTDWYDEIYQNGVVQQYDLSVAGGGKNGTYAFSGGYLDEEGILIHTNFKRYNFRMNSDAKLNDWFKVGESLQAVFINQLGNLGNNGEGTPISQAYRAQPIIPVYDIMGNFAGSRAPEMGNASNPVADLYRARNNNGKWARVLGDVYAEISFMKNFTLKSLFGYNWGQWNYKGYIIPNYEHSEPNKVNGMDANSNYSLLWNWTNTLNYSATFNDIHKINVVIGTEAVENNYQSLNASRRVYFSEDPKYMQLDAGEANRDNNGNQSQWSLFSQFGRVNYDLMGKYYLEASVRRDGSSRFSEANRYGVFPAASVGWAVTQENFMDGTKNWLDMLKLRLGYGVLGNDRIGDYNSYTTFASNSYMAAYAITGSNTSASIGFQPSALGNENVTWEETKTLNFGIEGVLFDNTLDFTLDIWNRNTSNMLVRDPIPNVMGLATAPFVNIGEMKNNGFDLEIGYNNTAFDGQLKYRIAATGSHYKNEIVSLYSDPNRFGDAANERQMLYSRYAVGSQFPEFWGYEVEGIFQTQAEADAHPQFGTTTYNAPGHFKYKDVNGRDDEGNLTGKPDGKLNVDDRGFIGSPHPDFTGGLNIDLAWGAFDLNMFFYGSYGNEMMNYVTRWIDYGMFNGGLSKKALYESWGSPKLNGNNAAATLPMLDQNSNSQEPSTAFIQDASYLRMKNLKFGYTLPKELLNKAQIKNLYIYLQVSNLFTITGYEGLDPEVNASGTYMGMDMGAWPTPRQVMFGVQLGL